MKVIIVIESEKQLIRRFQTEPSKVICLLCGTSKEIELCNIIQNGDFWNEWVDASAHDAPPPDFYSNKYGLMMDVMKVDDNTRKTKKGKLRNPRAELENKLFRELKESDVVTDETPDVLINAVTDLPTMEDHQFKWYFDSFKRVILGHNAKIPLYQSNHKNFKTVFFVFDESTAYAQLYAGQLHFYAHDEEFQGILKKCNADYVVWYAPYKYYDKLSVNCKMLQPIYRAAIIDVEGLRNSNGTSKKYMHGLMVSAEE
jgi:hypothetical protein